MTSFVPDGYISLHAYRDREAVQELGSDWEECIRGARMLQALPVGSRPNELNGMQIETPDKEPEKVSGEALARLGELRSRGQHAVKVFGEVRERLNQDLYSGKLIALVVNRTSGELLAISKGLWGADDRERVWATGFYGPVGNETRVLVKDPDFETQAAARRSDGSMESPKTDIERPPLPRLKIDKARWALQEKYPDVDGIPPSHKSDTTLIREVNELVMGHPDWKGDKPNIGKTTVRRAAGREKQ